MSKFNEQISAKESAIIAEKKTEQMAIASLGQALYEAEDNTTFPAESELIAGIIQEISELDEIHDKLQANVASEKQLAEESKTLEIERKKMKKAIQINLSALGRGAWEYWKFGGSFSESEEILAQLIKEDARLQDMDNAVSSNRQIASKTGKTLFSKGREALLSSRRRLIALSMSKLWEPTGKQILARISLDEFRGTQAEIPAEELQSLNERKEKIENRLQEVENENQSLRAELDTIPGKGSSTRRLAGIEQALEDKHSSLDNAYRQLGNVWLQSKEKNIFNDEVAARNTRFEEIAANIASLEEEKRILELQCEYRQIQLKRDKKAAEVEDTEKKIQGLQARLKTEKKQLKEIEKEAADIKNSLPEDNFLPEDSD